MTCQELPCLDVEEVGQSSHQDQREEAVATENRIEILVVLELEVPFLALLLEEEVRQHQGEEDEMCQVAVHSNSYHPWLSSSCALGAEDHRYWVEEGLQLQGGEDR